MFKTPTGTCIGHVHLKVSDLQRSIEFYRDVLGFDLVAELEGAAFLSADGYHHHIGLNTWESGGGSPPPRRSTGLYHVAINYPEQRDLARVFARLREQGVGLDGASDHGTHVALYLHDPDQNGIELAWDRQPEEWPRKDGKILFTTARLDLEALLREA